MQPVTPTTTTTTVRTAEAFRKPHPIRGILWGLIMGIGAAAIAILLKIIPFELVWAADRARRGHPPRDPVEHARSGEEAQG